MRPVPRAVVRFCRHLAAVDPERVGASVSLIPVIQSLDLIAVSCAGDILEGWRERSGCRGAAAALVADLAEQLEERQDDLVRAMSEDERAAEVERLRAFFKRMKAVG